MDREYSKMNSIEIAVLPVGEFEDDSIRNEMELMIGVLNRLGAHLSISTAAVTDEDARQSAQELLDKKPDLLLFIPSRGLSAPIMEAAGKMSHIPCLFWPVQGRYALPSSALAAGALREAGFPVELFYAPPDYPGPNEILRPILNAGRAYSRLRRSRIGVVGSLFPNLVSCRYDTQTVKSRLGVKLHPISYDELRGSIQSTSIPVQAIELFRGEIIRSFSMDAADHTALDAGIGLHLALKRIAEEKKLDGMAVECWSGLPRELGLNPCLGFIEDAYTLACEGDVMACVSLLMVQISHRHQRLHRRCVRSGSGRNADTGPLRGSCFAGL